jgi:hypothetical protein
VFFKVATPEVWWTPSLVARFELHNYVKTLPAIYFASSGRTAEIGLDIPIIFFLKSSIRTITYRRTDSDKTETF